MSTEDYPNNFENFIDRFQTAGTVLQGTRKPPHLWFHVMWWFVSQNNGAGAKNLKDVMGFKSYETALAWLHKLRRIMSAPDVTAGMELSK